MQNEEHDRKNVFPVRAREHVKTHQQNTICLNQIVLSSRVHIFVMFIEPTT